jgi:glycosyltransferase involved in cell wall biosynthesis
LSINLNKPFPIHSLPPNNSILSKNKFSKNNSLSTNFPLVSIIIRTQNRPHLLKHALFSLAEQTYSPIEVLVINDGGCSIQSTCKPFLSLFFDFIHYHFLTQVGRSHAANKGLELAQGNYIGFLDDDDWLAKEHIYYLIQEFNKNSNQSIIAVYSSTQCVDTTYDNHHSVIRIYDQDFDPTLLKIGNYIPIHSLLFKRQVLKNDPICTFDNDFDLYEDWDFWLQLLEQGPFIHIHQTTAFYRIISGSGSGVFTDKERAFNALKQITKKWSQRLTANDYINLIIRDRSLQKQLIHFKNQCDEIKQQFQAINQLKKTHKINIQTLEQEKKLMIKKYETEITSLMNYQKHLLNSNSWLITQPFRFIRRQLSIFFSSIK